MSQRQRLLMRRWRPVWVGVVVVGVFTLSGSASSSEQRAVSPAEAALENADVSPTFTHDVAPILQRSCQQCHHPTGIGPMSLITYEQAKPYARRIKYRVEARTMPPWHIDRAVGIQEFKNDISLTDEEITTIAQWVDGGTPQGDPADLPPAVEQRHAAEWRLADRFGPPDLVVRSTPYTVVANGQDQWWNPRVAFEGLEEERWIRAAEFKPAYPLGVKVVHHGHATLITPEGEDGQRTVGLARYGSARAGTSFRRGPGYAFRRGQERSPGPFTTSRLGRKPRTTSSRSASGSTRKTRNRSWRPRASGSS